MSSIIKVENISKSYILRHQNAEQYATFRDAIASKVKHLFRPNNIITQESEEFWALKDVSFEVNVGDRLGIIGRNGAGKSTLLKILSRIATPNKGRITINGRVASLLEVGTGFHPELTGRENIFLNGSILGMSKSEIQKKFDEIVAFAEVERFLDTPVKRYSSGMYVRLAFAVAAHLEPEILVVDEVLAVGDAEFQKKCMGKMQEVSGEGRTVLFVSHNMAAVSALCNKAIILDKGKLLDSGATNDMINLYLQVGKKNTGATRDDAPPAAGKKLKIRSVRVINDQEDTVSELNNEFGGSIEVEFEIIEEGRGYDVAIQLSHAQYGMIFTSCLKDIDTEKNDGVSWKVGNYKYKIALPLSLMRGGDYVLVVSAAIPKVEVLDMFKYETTFSVLDTVSPVARTTEGRGGAILPVIEWKKVV